MWGSTDDRNTMGQVLPTFSVHVDPQRLTASRLKALEQFAEPVSRDNPRCYIYALSPVSVQHGRAGGISSREILFLLRLIHGRELPQNVAYCVSQWAERYGEATLRTMTWLTLSPRCQWQGWRENDNFTVLRQDQEGIVLIPSMELTALITQLRQEGHYPSVRRLLPPPPIYLEPEHKDNGIFNQSMRLVADLYLYDQYLSANPSGDRLRLLKRLAEGMGLVAAQARQKKEAQAAIARYGGQSVWQAMGQILTAYINDEEYSEISGFEANMAEQVVRELEHLRQPYQVRRRLYDYLRTDGSQEWTAITPFVRRLRKESPKIIRATRSWDWSYLRRHDRPWEEVEDAWLHHLLTHEFWWLGLVELYCTKVQGCVSFRLTPAGQTLLEGKEASNHRAMVMAPKGWTVLEPAGMSVEELAQFLRFVQPQPLTCQWNVLCDQNTIHDGIVQGLSVERLKGITTKYGQDLPEAFTQNVAELEKQAESMRVEEGYLLTCQSASLLDSVMNTRSLSQCVAVRLAPTAAEIYPAAVGRFLRTAERAGISVDRGEQE